ncbi:MAG TPA: hypothetical protein VD973_25665 [Symbiobacteriaceae bacterium]|jgi:hypothetical protein|nr:hypothetical protein [Symbiobacteriaceae bacterium]
MNYPTKVTFVKGEQFRRFQLEGPQDGQNQDPGGAIIIFNAVQSLENQCPFARVEAEMPAKGLIRITVDDEFDKRGFKKQPMTFNILHFLGECSMVLRSESSDQSLTISIVGIEP